MFCFQQIFARKIGTISEDTATEKWPRVIHGPTVRGNVPYREQTSRASTARKKMSSSRVCTVVKNLGWVFLTSTQKGNSCGAMEHLPTSITGLNTNRTTMLIRTVSILLGFLKITTTSGTMSIAQTATDLPVNKVYKHTLSLPFC